MSWYGDPDGIDRLGVRLSTAAQRVRERAATVRTAAGAGGWRGPAAQAFHDSVARESTRLDRAADELDDAAAAMHRHADAVREEIARLLRLEQAAERLLSSGWSHLKEWVA